jgi:hypothetical protein
MELNFTEIDDLDTQKYWEPQKKNTIKKKRVTFDDILLNMNLVVNKNGVLQAMSQIQREEQEIQHYSNDQFFYEQQYQSQYQSQNQSQNQQQYQSQNQQPLDPSVKHSYIFNKYFKDYRDVNDKKTPEIRTPKTIEEYRQMVLEDKIKRIREAYRISQIKSTKLLFTGNPVVQHHGIQQPIKASKNNLRLMNFK